MLFIVICTKKAAELLNLKHRTMQNLLQAGLLLHMIGLATIAGVTLASYVTSKQFRVQYALDKQRGAAIMQATTKLPRIAGLGLLVQIISGMTMLAATRGAYAGQLWFRIKMIVVLMVIAGFIFLNSRLQKRLRKWVTEDLQQEGKAEQIGNLAGKISYTQLSLLCFFILIFFLSVFRFT
jgi:hypothetical protein